MPPFPIWADLPPELLCRIADALELKCYASARGACTAWRCALAPPTPSLLVVPDDARCCRSAASLPACRSFDLKATTSVGLCVGSSSGWLAFSHWTSFSLFNPVTAAKIMLPPLVYTGTLLPFKLVFAPNPTRDDFAAAAIYGIDGLAYVTSGVSRWAVLDPVRLAAGDQLVDLVYNEKEDRVYCLTGHGDVRVLCLPERRRRPEPVIVDDKSSSSSSGPVIPPLSRHNKPATRRDDRLQLIHFWRSEMLQSRRPVKDIAAQLPADQNALATAEPLLSVPFDAATSFAPPYNKISAFTGAKNLVFCDGNLYQVWRNTSCTVTLQLPGGGRRRVVKDEVFVLRYYPQRQPCWDAVMDLGGYSVFLGKNNAVSMRTEAVPGLKGNCVYWIGGRGRDHGMVFDMATGRSTSCLLPAAAGGAPHSTICWYFLG